MATLMRGLAPQHVAGPYSSAPAAGSRAGVGAVVPPARLAIGRRRAPRPTAPTSPIVAQAGEAGVSAAADAAAAAVATTTTTSLPLPPDAVISVGFVAAAVALSLVTGGVAYLSFLTWQDGRAEAAAAEAEAAAERRRCVWLCVWLVGGRAPCSRTASSLARVCALSTPPSKNPTSLSHPFHFPPHSLSLCSAAADAARGKPPKRKKEVTSRGGGQGFGG